MIMKTVMKFFALIILIASIFTSCNKKDEFRGADKELQLPPKESMDFTFSDFKSDLKSGLKSTTGDTSTTNYKAAKRAVGVWSTFTFLTTAVPTAAFYRSFAEVPEHIDDYTWQWKYEVDGFASTYNARLVGKTDASFQEIKWEMYVEKKGIAGFPEFLWFEGTSKTNRTSGTWTLYHSYEFQDPFLTLEWTADGTSEEDVASVKYTFVRETNNNGQTEPFYGSYLMFGKQTGELNAFFDVHYFDVWIDQFLDVNIEWSTENYNGKVKSFRQLGDEEWHCWDTEGYDIDCE